MRGGPWLFALSLLGCAAREMPISLGHPLAGEEAPPFSALASGERSVAVPSKSPRTRAVVIDFWASWCAECLRTMPSLEALYREKRDDGLSVVGVSVDETDADADGAIARIGASFPIVHDPGMRVAGAYGVGAIPLSFVLDREGRVRWVGRDPERLRRAVMFLLEE